MKCPDWEREIAAESESPALEEHLNVCADCRALAREMEENRAALQSLAVDRGALGAVRARVLGEIQPRKRRRAWWTWSAAAAAACVAILSAGLILPRFKNPARPGPVEFATAPKLVEWTVKPARRTVRIPPDLARIPRPQAPAVASAEPLVVKMLTNDPDVIIVWLIDQKGGS